MDFRFQRKTGHAADITVTTDFDALSGHKPDSKCTWVILDFSELPRLMDVSKLNPGPSGEDADAGRSTSRCRITLR
jgi:hypothetical protein